MIGIFDSGLGGLSVLKTAVKMLPNENFIYYGDSKNAPYGTKSKEEVLELSIRICDFLVNKGVKAIVVACNTATSAAINELRDLYDIPIIGMEPAIKPAVEDNCGGDIAVMATPMTLKEKKFENLINKVSGSVKIYRIPAPKVVELVELGKADSKEMDELVTHYFSQLPLHKIESVVLGCTHFIFIKKSVLKLFEHIKLYDGNKGTVDQLIRKVKTSSASKASLEIINSGGQRYVDRSYELFNSLEV